MIKIVKKLRNFISQWNYRLHMLWDRYSKGEYITNQSHLHVYTGFWDRIDKQTRSPYMYKTYCWVEKQIINKLNSIIYR